MIVKCRACFTSPISLQGCLNFSCLGRGWNKSVNVICATVNVCSHMCYCVCYQCWCSPVKVIAAQLFVAAQAKDHDHKAVGSELQLHPSSVHFTLQSISTVAQLITGLVLDYNNSFEYVTKEARSWKKDCLSYKIGLLIRRHCQALPIMVFFPENAVNS